MADIFSFADEPGQLKVIRVHEPSIGLRGVLMLPEISRLIDKLETDILLVS